MFWPKIYLLFLYTSCVTPTYPAYLSLRLRHNFPYGAPAPNLSQLFYQFRYLEQVLEAKSTSATGHCHEWIFRHYRCPARWNRAQTTFGIVEIDSIFAPVIAIGDQLKFLPSQRMVWMDYLKVSAGMFIMRCS